jgi:hypothetical protein
MTVLFMGYSLQDHDLKSVLERVQQRYSGNSPTRYLLISDNEKPELEDYYKNLYKVDFIRYQWSYTHSGAELFLRQLLRDTR